MFKKPDESMATYIARVKALSRRLIAANENVTSTNLINKLIDGLDSSYESLRTTLCVLPNLTEDRLTQILMSEEARRLYKSNDDVRRRQSQSFIREQSRRNIDDMIQGSRSRFRERSASPSTTDDGYSKRDRRGNVARYCETCRAWGHTDDTCFQLHPELLNQRRSDQSNRRPPGPLSRTQIQSARPPPPRPPPHVLAIAEQTDNSQDVHTDDSNEAGYAMPMHFGDGDIWDYYAHAMVLTADMESCLSVHQHVEAITIADPREVPPPWVKHKVVSPTVTGSSTLKEGDFIQVPRNGDWLIDSGASNHYTSYRHILTEFRATPDIGIQTGSGIIYGKGIGNVTIHSSLGIRKIHDVIWVPLLAGKHNLLSIPQLTGKGCKVTMSGLIATIYSDNSESVRLLEGVFRGKGYFVSMRFCNQTMHLAQIVLHKTPERNLLVPAPIAYGGALLSRRSSVDKQDAPECAMLAGTEDTQPLEIWHLRLGHLHQAAIQQLTSRATGLHIGPPKPQTLSMNCESCLRGSQHRTISHVRSKLASCKLEHIWADIKGPLLDKDIYGFRYFAIFVDEFTRYSVELPMTRRSHLCDAYKLFEARAERVSGCMIVNLHADGEFISDDLRTHLRNRGIALLLTQPYAPQMNSIAERTIRTVIEHASSMLWATKLPVGFWSSAVKCAVFLMNRSPHSALDGSMTPYEAWFGRKPNLGFLRVFGCRAAAHVPDELRPKTSWTSKSSPHCILIGYSDTENLFELWDVDKSVVIRKRDVVFWEHELGHPKLTSPLPHGVSILPAIAGELVTAVTPLRDASTPIPSSAPPNDLPLNPRPGKQSIDKLASEPPIQERNKSGNFRFISESLPSDIASKVSKITSNFPSDVRFADDVPNQVQVATLETTENLVAQYGHKIDSYDEVFMQAYEAEHWIPSEIAMSVALGDTLPVEAYNVGSSRSTKPLFIPHIDRDVPQTYKQAMPHPHHVMWKEAMDREIQALKQAHTWDIVELPKGRKAFPNRWVFAYIRGPKVVELQEKIWRERQDGSLTEKQIEQLTVLKSSPDAMLGKARLVARGDLQMEGIDYEQTFAPVVKFVSLRIILSWAARQRMKVKHWDITSAFLHGNIDMTVYMQQPQGYTDGTNRVCLLKKAIYGLHQSARQFYLKLDEVLADIGYRRLGADWAIWTHPATGGIIATHVDDMSACGRDEQLTEAKDRIGKILGVKDLGDITRYLNITCDYDFEKGRFLLSQVDYIMRLLEDYDMSNAFEVTTPMVITDREKWEDSSSDLLNDRNKKRYQALVGSLLYLMHATRPDLAYSVIRLSQYSAKPRSCHWEGLQRILRYLKRTKQATLILGTPMDGTQNDTDHELVGYFDAAHADTISRRSTCGYFFLWNGSPISWCSRVQRTVALSTTEAEYMSGTEATKEAIWIRGLLSQICGDKQIRCVLRGDNQGSLALAANPVFHQRTKHIDIRQKFITEMVNKGIIAIEYVPTQLMFADGLTKPLPRETHWKHCKNMGLILITQSTSDKHAGSTLPTSDRLSGSSSRKRKLSCDNCGNLFADEIALQRHKLKE